MTTPTQSQPAHPAAEEVSFLSTSVKPGYGGAFILRLRDS